MVLRAKAKGPAAAAAAASPADELSKRERSAAARKAAEEAEKKKKLKSRGAGATANAAVDAAASATPVAAKAEIKMDFVKVYKEQEIPKVLPDAEYPPWVFKLDQPLESLASLRKRASTPEAISKLDYKDLRRYLKLVSREDIKSTNRAPKKI